MDYSKIIGMKTHPIEDYFALTTGLLKKSLKKARDGELVEGEYVNYLERGRPSALDYSIERDFEDNVYLLINVTGEPQKIALFDRELNFGTRTCFICGCGRHVNILYLKLGYFACRHCQMLRYKSTRINRSSDYGIMLFRENKRAELMDERDKITRPYYRGRYTKRFLLWMSHCIKYGLFDNLIRDLKEDVRNESRKQ